MAKRKALNERRLTKKEVAALLAGNATDRPDLEQELSTPVLPIRTYELPDNRVLWVFQSGGLAGKGDIYTLDYCHRFIGWAKRLKTDRSAGRYNSVSHWRYFSSTGAGIADKAAQLVQELEHAILGDRASLEMTYAGLDAASGHVESIGIAQAQTEIYDHLVAYVGEVIRLRTHGEWKIETHQGEEESYPFISAPRHAVIMPVNVVYSEMTGPGPADFRREAANEVRRARANYLPPFHNPL
jgi:hypothetical protein